MKVLVLYRPDSEHGRVVEDFLSEFRRRYGDTRLEVMNIDSREGSATASLYDIMQYPAIVVVQNDGTLQQSWVGQPLPLMNEIFAYATA